ncbi:sterol desaturase [Ameyamaea chiangmaiensis NBRC 103196]|uniref:Sterol desaturase family protein n=1 Tax=Ameyamaea chiangmaiensis TaxID=442969 RepID=A0A850PDK3_9PROT|nr:sterol desaturase family protein [Ameyamaea chiangmaiensis]MBS4076400.1 sterol desaturase family protein [Ameyamaea chiangmaiensis]NVN42088.1 sterol desaturase family protein [Ameyamaea chiangmaiensis]GBQ63436.1 sterol desaturase [Ameyamaea chiangmaiensis NBRC 103196]
MPVRLFRNDTLERLTYMPIAVFVPVWGIVLAGLAYEGSALPMLQSFLSFGTGLALWTLMEYIAHRHVFHLNLSSAVGKRFIFLLHGNHHAEPGDKLRNMMPLTVTLPIAAALWIVARMFAGAPGLAMLAGFVAGYVAYDLIHYSCHQYAFRRGWLGGLRRHHLSHHYAAPNRNFAVSNTFWDRIFRTKAGRVSS